MTAIAIGELSRRAGVRIETVRYYERIGVMPAPPRTGGGHRAYGKAHVKRLAFVRRARELGFSLDDVRELLRLVDEGDVTCEQVRELTLRHLADVRAKIADLRRMERTLADTAARCAGDETPDCAILETLYEG